MSKELTITTDPEFEGLIPKLTAGEYQQLEQSILSVKKCREALITWNGMLVDGHNRYKICQEHGLKFKTGELKADTREDVTLWILNNQFGRRNLTKRQIEYCRGKQYEAEKKVITNQSGKNQHSKAVGQNDIEANDTPTFTENRLALLHKVSPSTIKRDAKFSGVIDAIGEVSTDAKNKILSCDAKISKQDLMKLSKCSKEEIEVIAVQIGEGTYESMKKEAKNDFDIEATLNSIEQADKSVHQSFISFVDILEESCNRIDKFIEKELSIRDNQDILSRLHTHAKHLDFLIQKLSKKQGADMDSES